MKKRIAGMLYGVILEKPLNKILNWKSRIEKDYLMYCRRGCAVCYCWKCKHRSKGETPYKKFRR